MKLAVIVTEFPKTTETFIARDLMAFRAAGADLRLYHAAPWRDDQILHRFAAPLAEHARHVPLGAPSTLAAAARHPRAFARRAAAIARHQSVDPAIAAKSLALLPAGLRLGEELRDWGATHVHAEFAGHPATLAWIAHAVSGVPYSVSCRAHDIFRSQALLAEKFAEASAVRAVSGFAARFIGETVRGMRADEIHVIHSSVDVADIVPLPPFSGAGFPILYVGALQSRKGVDVLLRAVAGLDGEWSLEIVGDGPERARLEGLARRLDLDHRVAFRGQTGYEEIAAKYAGAAVCVAPSVIGPGGRTEGIPNVMIEALAYRRPAISTNLSGIPELIRHRETGWLTEAGDVEGLRAALREVRADPEAAARIAARGRAHVAAEFDLATNARRQLALFGPAHPRSRAA